MPFSYDKDSVVYGQQFSLAVAFQVYIRDLRISNHNKSMEYSERGSRKCLILDGIFLNFGSIRCHMFFVVAVNHALRDYRRIFKKKRVKL